MRTLRCVALGFALLLPCEASPQQRDVITANAFGLPPGANAVGFRVIDGDDRSRTVTGIGSVARPRPVRTYIWYPARRAGRPMRFGRYAALADGDVWPAELIGSLHDKLAFSRRPLARGMGPTGYAALLQRPVLAVENAEPLAGPFPLIVLGQGFWIEPAISLASWAEYLAGHGFVVATAPLVGTNSPVVRVDQQDLETYVQDLQVVIARARRLTFVSEDKLGVVGSDMGGMATLLLAMRNRDVDAFVGLASGILFEHPSGVPRTSAGYDPLALRVPWLHIHPATRATPPPGSRAPSLFDAARYSDRYLLLTPDIGHPDLTIDGLIEGHNPGGIAVGPAYTQETPTGSEAHKALRPYVLNFLTAFLAPDARRREDGVAFLSRAPEESIPGWKMTLEHRPAAPPSVTFDEFVEAVVAGRADEAIKRLRSVAAVEPDHMLLNESHLGRLCANLLFTWGLGQETIPVIEFLIERYPSSPGARGLLAEAHLAAGNHRAATEIYSRILEQRPNDPNVRSRLDWLRSRQAPTR